jgi:hypothetical protein
MTQTVAAGRFHDARGGAGALDRALQGRFRGGDGGDVRRSRAPCRFSLPGRPIASPSRAERRGTFGRGHRGVSRSRLLPGRLARTAAARARGAAPASPLQRTPAILRRRIDRESSPRAGAQVTGSALRAFAGSPRIAARGRESPSLRSPPRASCRRRRARREAHARRREPSGSRLPTLPIQIGPVCAKG